MDGLGRQITSDVGDVVGEHPLQSVHRKLIDQKLWTRSA